MWVKGHFCTFDYTGKVFPTTSHKNVDGCLIIGCGGNDTAIDRVSNLKIKVCKTTPLQYFLQRAILVR